MTPAASLTQPQKFRCASDAGAKVDTVTCWSQPKTRELDDAEPPAAAAVSVCGPPSYSYASANVASRGLERTESDGMASLLPFDVQYLL